MHVLQLHLEGYGRFNEFTVALQPGFQVVLGPNEQGKSTLRHFIGDMLYGQKMSATQRRYEDSNTLRHPWQANGNYGGRLVYRLDEGREIEVARQFTRKQEFTQVFDHTNGVDISSEFEQMRNRELTFADVHLGLSKAVFTNVATIGHLGLNHLGDTDALSEVRNKLLSLADSGDESGSADTALKQIQAHIKAIGKAGERSKRPLTATLARLTELDGELAGARAQRVELDALEQQRLGTRNTMAQARTEQERLTAALQDAGKLDRAARLREAQQLQAEMEEVQTQCFALSAVRDFPLELAPEVQRAQYVLATAQKALERSDAARTDLGKRLGEERERTGHAEPVVVVQDIAEDAEARLTELELDTQRLRTRIEETEAAHAKALERRDHADGQLAELPDFSRMAADPVEWLNQLARSFILHTQTRDSEQEQLTELQATVANLESELAEPRAAFEEDEDFSTEARDYDVQTRLNDEQLAQLTAKTEGLGADIEDCEDSLPGYRICTFLTVVVAGGFAACAHYMDRLPVYIPGAVFGLAALYFIGNWITARVALKQFRGELIEAQEQAETLRGEDTDLRGHMRQRMEQAGRESVREMEALFDKLRTGTARLEELQQDLRQQDRKVLDEEQQVKRLFDQLQTTFDNLGVGLQGEGDVDEATDRAVARYQEYRDAKRRFSENRELVSSHGNELDAMRKDLAEQEEEEVRLALDVRHVMRQNGYRDESKHTRVVAALQSYRIRNAKLREQQGRLGVLEENAANLEQQISVERTDLSTQEEALAKLLRRGNADTVEQWQARCEEARQYRDAWSRRTTLQERQSSLLRDESLEELEAKVTADGPVVEGQSDRPHQLKDRLDALTARIERLREEEHAMSLALAERAAGARSVNEIEEEQAQLQHRADALTAEREAAAYAAASIETVARDNHARIAPGLAARASEYLGEITDGAYTQLALSRDFHISVRVPQTERMQSNPEQHLSKGTVDQIYLALRLAMVQGFSNEGETVPMLLDDPLTNYDDARLSRACHLLQRIGERSQVILFTCRQDVADAATFAGGTLIAL